MKLKIGFYNGGDGLVHAILHSPDKGDHVYFETRWHDTKELAVKELEQWVRGDLSVVDGEYFIEMKQVKKEK